MAEIPALDDTATLWSAAAADRVGRPLLVLLHGYGADERDLFGLVPYLPPEFVVVAVRAPLTPPFPAPGYAWYPVAGLAPASRGSGAEPRIELASRDLATESQHQQDVAVRAATHVTDAASRVIGWLDAAAPDAVVGLLGFSQGAAVALQALRLQPERFAFAVNLSGYVTPGSLAGDSPLAERRPPVFWGRGTRDDVIPDFLVEHTVAWLPEHSELSGRVYQGLTHSVSEQELDDVRIFLEKQLEVLAAEK